MTTKKSLFRLSNEDSWYSSEQKLFIESEKFKKKNPNGNLKINLIKNLIKIRKYKINLNPLSKRKKYVNKYYNYNIATIKINYKYL